MPTAIIVDDEPLLRRELRETLADLWPELAVVGEYADGAAALATFQEVRPDVAFLDIRMPKLSGLELAERVQGAEHPDGAGRFHGHGFLSYRLAAVCHRPARSLSHLAQRRRTNGDADLYLGRTLGLMMGDAQKEDSSNQRSVADRGIELIRKVPGER